MQQSGKQASKLFKLIVDSSLVWEAVVSFAAIKQTIIKKFGQAKGIKSKVLSVNDVDKRLMSINIDDFGALVQHKRYKWNPTYDES